VRRARRLDGDGLRRQRASVKVAAKSSRKKAPAASARATLTLTSETYAKIDRLRGAESRSAWVKDLIDREEARRERLGLAELLSAQYTAAVCRETLAVNAEFPVHEE